MHPGAGAGRPMSGPKVGWWPGRAGRRGMQIRIRATGWAIIDSESPGSAPEGGGAGGKRGGELGPRVDRGGGLKARRHGPGREHLELLLRTLSVPKPGCLPGRMGLALICSCCWLLGGQVQGSVGPLGWGLVDTWASHTWWSLTTLIQGLVEGPSPYRWKPGLLCPLPSVSSMVPWALRTLADMR